MADTFSNDLRLRLQESGSNAGTWGDLLNGTITNIASGFGQGSEAIPNASTHTITLADGTADEARSLYLKCTGGGQACTVTLGPNTISKVWIIDNATSYTLTFSQGSGANVAIAAGAVKVIATDGAGSGAAVVDTLDGLEGSLSSLAVTGTATMDGLTVNTGSYGAVGAGSGRMYGSTTHGLVIQGNGTTNDFLFLGSDGSDSFKIANNGDISFYEDTGTTPKLFWDASAESLGIGGAATDGTFQVKGTGINTGITNVLIDASFADASNATGLTIGHRTDETTAVIAPRTGTGNLAFYNYNGGWSETMRLTNTGNVGIGVVPEAWTYFSPIQAKRSSFAGSDGQTGVGYNWYFDGAYKYIANDYALAYQQNATSGAHSWSTAASGTAGATATLTERIRLDSSGRQLIGNTVSRGTAFQTNLQVTGVSGSSSNYAGLGVISTNNEMLGVVGTWSSGENSLMIAADPDNLRPSSSIVFTTDAAERMRLDQNGTLLLTTPSSGAYGYLNIKEAGSGDVRFGMQSGNDYDAIAGTWTNNNLLFYTNGTKSMTLSASGSLLVGTNSNINFSGIVASHNFSDTTNNRWVSGFRNATTGTAWGIALNYSAVSPNSTSNNFLYLTDSAGLRCSVMSNGGVQNYQANDLNLSDRREKTNFLPAKSYLDVICAIPVQTFNYIDQNMEEDPSVTLGVVAQDVQTVAPELVTESNWGTHEDPKMRLSIYQTDFQYALMKSIQEQQATIEALTQRIETLENN